MFMTLIKAGRITTIIAIFIALHLASCSARKSASFGSNTSSKSGSSEQTNNENDDKLFEFFLNDIKEKPNNSIEDFNFFLKLFVLVDNQKAQEPTFTSDIDKSGIKRTFSLTDLQNLSQDKKDKIIRYIDFLQNMNKGLAAVLLEIQERQTGRYFLTQKEFNDLKLEVVLAATGTKLDTWTNPWAQEIAEAAPQTVVDFFSVFIQLWLKIPANQRVLTEGDFGPLDQDTWHSSFVDATWDYATTKDSEEAQATMLAREIERSNELETIRQVLQGTTQKTETFMVQGPLAAYVSWIEFQPSKTTIPSGIYEGSTSDGIIHFSAQGTEFTLQEIPGFANESPKTVNLALTGSFKDFFDGIKAFFKPISRKAKASPPPTTLVVSSGRELQISENAILDQSKKVIKLLEERKEKLNLEKRDINKKIEDIREEFNMLQSNLDDAKILKDDEAIRKAQNEINEVTKNLRAKNAILVSNMADLTRAQIAIVPILKEFKKGVRKDNIDELAKLLKAYGWEPR